jgi:signal transduction histidine kinase
VAVMPQVDKELAARLGAALFMIPHDSFQGSAAVIHGFEIPAIYDGVENLLRRLRLPPFDRPPEFTFTDLWRRYDVWIVTLALLLLLLATASIALVVLYRRSQQALRQLKQAEEALSRTNEELEQRVRERTALLQRQTEELALANERLQEVDRLKTIFLSSMSHELRTPLNSIIGFSTVLLDEWAGPVTVEQKQNLASIQSSGRLLLNMITDILDVTQIESGTVTPAIEEFDLYDLIAKAESEVAAAIRKKKLELLSEVPRQLMRTDQRRLLQCVRSILDNAVKFTDTGSISVEARIVSCPGETPHGELVEITVSDTGIGIGEEDLSGMFQPFHRIVTFGRTITPGTRLGLFLTKKIATEILNGDLSVASEQGKGSRFSLRVPVRLA